MKVNIRNKSNKKRSLKLMNELKQFSIYVAEKLDINKHIDLINLNYTKNNYNYYIKDKPLYGFYKLYNKRKVTINFANEWDLSQNQRRLAILHEMTHVKQIIEGRLVLTNNFKDIIWNGKLNKDWKKFKFSVLYTLDYKSQRKYIEKYLAWESEVQYIVDKFNLNNNVILK